MSDQPTQVPPEPYPLPQEHPWQTAIVPIVAVCGGSAVAIGAGFTIATFGIVITPAAVAVTALQRASQASDSVPAGTSEGPRTGCVLGQGMQGGRHVGKLVPIQQIYAHEFTDLALLQLALPAPNPVGSFPILPLTMKPPDVGTRLVVAGYSGIANPGKILGGNQVIHDWQLTAYWTSVAGFAQAPRKQGPPAQLMLLADNRSFDTGFIGGPVFSVHPPPYAQPYDPVCAVRGQYTSEGRAVAYGMSPTPALGLHVVFPDGTGLASRPFCQIAQAGELTMIDGVDQLQLQAVDERYSLPVAAAPAAQSTPQPAATPAPRIPERDNPTAWLLAQGLELGYYSAGKVPVIRYTPGLHSAARPPAMTASHEKAHMALTASTAYGLFVCELAMVVRFLEEMQNRSPSEQVAASYRNLSECMQQLMQGCWLTQEAGATMLELLSAPAAAGPDTVAQMRRELPPTYAHAVEVLEAIMGTLHLPFAPGSEGLRTSVAMGLCSAAMNSDIVDYFSALPVTDSPAILGYLADSATHPDHRLLAVYDAARSDPGLLDPIARQLMQSIIRMGDELRAAKSRDEWNLRYSDAGRRVDKLVQERVRDLGLFPVCRWIDTSPEESGKQLAAIRASILRGTGVDPEKWPQVNLKELGILDVSEKQSFGALDHSHDAQRAKSAAPFAAWLERVRTVDVPAAGRLVFSAAPLPQPQDDGSTAWTCYLASLMVAPGKVRFNRLAIEFDAVAEADFVSVLDALRGYPMTATVYQKVMPLIAGALERVLRGRAIPLFAYLPTVSPRTVDEQLQTLGNSARARILADVLPANQIVSVFGTNTDAPRLLWFESGAAANSYRSVMQARSIAINDGPLDTANQDDFETVVAAWMCTYGAMGSTETSF